MVNLWPFNDTQGSLHSVRSVFNLLLEIIEHIGLTLKNESDGWKVYLIHLGRVHSTQIRQKTGSLLLKASNCFLF